MKKKFLFIVVAAAALYAGYHAHEIQNKTKLAGIVLANVEALAQASSEGTKAGICYVKTTNGSYEWVPFCDSQTDDSRIYPCPTEKEYGRCNRMSTDRCTK